jgi:hypothetical protein
MRYGAPECGQGCARLRGFASRPMVLLTSRERGLAVNEILDGPLGVEHLLRASAYA